MILFGIIILFGMLTQAALGFGANVVIVTLALHILPIPQIIAVILPLNLLLCFYIVSRYHKHINYALLGSRILPIMLVGFAAGYAVLQISSDTLLKKAFGALIVLLASAELYKIFLKENTDENALNPVVSTLFLLGGGLMQGMYASGGPMAVYVTSRIMPDKSAFRATMISLWIVLNSLLYGLYWFSGKATLATSKTSAFMLVALVAGIGLGELIHDKLPKRTFRILIYVVLLGSGTSALLS